MTVNRSSFNDVPPNWNLCRDHGWAGIGGACPYCDTALEGDGEMWKRLDDLSTSEPHARLHLATLGIWTYLLTATDSKGRMKANAKLIARRCMPLREVDPQTVVEALAEMNTEGAIHLYNVDGPEPWLVIHDHHKHVPPGALRYKEPEGPEPPDLCPCLSRPESGEKTPPVTSPSPSPSPLVSQGEGSIGLLFQKARDAKIPGRLDTLRTYLESWIARSSLGRVDEILMDPWTRGKTVIEIQERFFGKDTGGKSWKELLK